MMEIVILRNSDEIRNAFIEKFVLPWEDFQIRHKDWLDDIAKTYRPVSEEELYLWDRMPDYQTVSFADALELLQSIDGKVLVLSENASKPYCRGIRIDGAEYKGAVATANASDLAKLIEFEWHEKCRSIAQDMEFGDTILPDDLYVLDPSMEKLIVFTHENDYCESVREEPMNAAQNRFCMMYGFTK